METETLELRGAHGWFSMHTRLLEPGVSRYKDCSAVATTFMARSER